MIYFTIISIFFSLIFRLCSTNNAMSNAERENAPLTAQHTQILERLVDIESKCAESVSPKIPKFFRDDPISFFIAVEASFAKSRISTQSTMAQHLIANLDPDLIPHIKDIIVANPVPIDVYDQIKNRLISSFAVSAETRLRQLLKGEVISEEKPSLLLSRLYIYAL